MAIIEESIEIKQPSNKVFDYVTNIGRNLPEWELNCVEAEQTSTGSEGVGTICRGINRVMGLKMSWTLKISEYEPDKSCRLVVTAGSSRIDEQQLFETTNMGTRFTQIYDIKSGGPLRLISCIVIRLMRKQMKKNLSNLKSILEAQP